MLLSQVNKFYIFWVWVCSLNYLSCNAHAPYCHLWPVWFSYTLRHKWQDFRRKVIEQKMCRFICSKTSIWNICHSERYLAKYHHKCTYGFIMKYRLFLSNVIQAWGVLAEFLKTLEYQIQSFQWELKCSMRTDRQITPDEANSHSSQILRTRLKISIKDLNNSKIKYASY